MASNYWMLIFRGPGWTVTDARRETLEGFGGNELEPVISYLREAGYAGEPVLLAIPAERCMVASLALNRQQRKRQQARLFAIEESLPLAAESLVADFVMQGEHQESFGVAADVHEFSPMVEAFEAAGIRIEAICPTTLLAVQSLVRTRAVPPNARLLLQAGEFFELVTLRDGQPRDWRRLSATSDALLRQERETSLRERDPLPLYLVDVHPSFIQDLATAGVPASVMDFGVSEDGSDITAMERAAATQVDFALSYRQSPWIDLRRGSLAPTDRLRRSRVLIRLAAVSAVILFLALVASMYGRAYRLEQLANDYAARQRQLFVQTFPNQRVPLGGGVRTRMESERTKLASATGISSEAPQLDSAVKTVHQLLASLPNDLACDWQQLRFEPVGKVTLEGHVKSHREAARVAEALSRGGFDVEAPVAESLSNNLLSLRLTAERQPDVD